LFTNVYHFITHWTIPGATREEIYAVIADVEALPRWWPSVYLDVTPVSDTGDRNGIGRAFDLHTKGWLPYTLRWRLTVQEVKPPLGSTIGASGDFNGRGIWRFIQTADGVDVLFDWKLTADKPLLKYLSPLLKPAFAANHRWAMEQGRVSLLRELERRRDATKPADAPPGPTTYEPYVAMAAGTVAVAALIGLSVWCYRRCCRKG
jgi:uncharacterized protein YndB with AHSA1/START domain